MGLGDECDKPGCINRKKIIDRLVSLFYGEKRIFDVSGVRFVRSPDAETSPLEVGSRKKLEETVAEMGKPLVELTVRDLDGNLDLEKIVRAKFQNQKIAIELERLETLLRQANLSADELQNSAQEISDDLEREMKKMIALILED